MIKPILMTPNQVHFGSNNFDKNNDKALKLNPNSNSLEYNAKVNLGAGLAFGTILAATVTSIYKDYQINNLMKDINTQITSNPNTQLKVEDRNYDEIPEIVLIDKNGDEYVYDFTTGKEYINEDGELIERY